jgi:serine/threonine-protein kinase HipA
LGYQQMIVGDKGAESSLANALSQAKLFGLGKGRAAQITGNVAGVVARWKDHFASHGVANRDIDQLEQYIDGDRLRLQREEYAK